MQSLRLMGWSTLILALSLLAAPLHAQQPAADKEYKLINPPQKTESGKQIEVVEFFSYACPHCADFEAPLQDWLKRKPKEVVFKPVPMVFRESWKPLAKLYYTLDAMGVAEKYHQAVFDAIHKQKQELFTDAAVIDWAGKQGLDKARFEATYNSFGVDTKVQRAMAMGKAYGIQFTPAIAVNGKYWTGPSMVATSAGVDMRRFFAVVDQLIAMERGSAAEAAPAPKKKS